MFVISKYHISNQKNMSQDKLEVLTNNKAMECCLWRTHIALKKKAYYSWDGKTLSKSKTMFTSYSWDEISPIKGWHGLGKLIRWDNDLFLLRILFFSNFYWLNFIKVSSPYWLFFIRRISGSRWTIKPSLLPSFFFVKISFY